MKKEDTTCMIQMQNIEAMDIYSTNWTYDAKVKRDIAMVEIARKDSAEVKNHNGIAENTFSCADNFVFIVQRTHKNF